LHELIDLDLDVFAHTPDDEDEDEDDKPEESESEGVLRYCCSCSLQVDILTLIQEVLICPPIPRVPQRRCLWNSFWLRYFRFIDNKCATTHIIHPMALMTLHS
jgi:hypothetical protein